MSNPQTKAPMKTAETVLKQKIDEFSQHNGSYPSYKHSDRYFMGIILEAMEEYKNQPLSPSPNHAQLCPKCNGQGTVAKPPHVPGDVNEWSSTSAVHVCDVCNGDKLIYPKLSASPKLEEMLKLFDNNSDCYADTWTDIGTEMKQGEVVPAMTRDKFIEVLGSIYFAGQQSKPSHKISDEQIETQAHDWLKKEYGKYKPSEFRAYCESAKWYRDNFHSPSPQQQEIDCQTIENLVNEFKKEILTSSEEAFSSDAEIAAGFRHFIQWLKQRPEFSQPTQTNHGFNLLKASNKILAWYNDENEKNPHSTEEWQKAYEELRIAVMNYGLNLPQPTGEQDKELAIKFAYWTQKNGYNRYEIHPKTMPGVYGWLAPNGTIAISDKEIYSLFLNQKQK